jgi:hypothetical protein
MSCIGAVKIPDDNTTNHKITYIVGGRGGESVTKCKYGPVGVCGTGGIPDLVHFHFSHSTPVTAAS